MLLQTLIDARVCVLKRLFS